MNEPVDISIVIPAFNEAKRLPSFLEAVISHGEKGPLFYENLVVDDGSNDASIALARDFQKRIGRLDVVEIGRHHSMGYAIKRGLLESRGAVVAFLDADGSTAPDEIEKDLHYLTEQGFDLIVGSRVLTLYPREMFRVFPFSATLEAKIIPSIFHSRNVAKAREVGATSIRDSFRTTRFL